MPSSGADQKKAPAAAPEVAASPPPQADPQLPQAQLKQERANVDHFVRKATIGRFRQALSAVAAYDESELHGFDIACVPKAKLFGRSQGPRVLGRVVVRVDAESVADAWVQAGKWDPSSDVCVFLMGSGMAAAAELAGAIATQRRKTRAAKVTLIPIDARNWEAHVPTDAPAIAKDVLAQLRRP
jgi:hypothetical protein